MCEVRSFPILFTYQERRPPISTLFPYTTLFRSFDRAHAMLVKRGIFLGAIWQIVIRFLFRHNRTGIEERRLLDRKSTRLNSSHVSISYAVLCLKKKIRVLKQRCLLDSNMLLWNV